MEKEVVSGQKMSDSFTRRHTTIAQNIVNLVKDHPAVKEDYRKLIQYYWYYVDGMKNFVPLDVLKKLTQPQSIGRAFRKLIEEGRISIPEKTKQKRWDEETKYRNHYGGRGTRRDSEPNG